MTSGEPLQVEATGETVGEAKWHALRELEQLAPGLDKATVQFEVVSEGERGLLGVGYAPARVVATAEVPAPADAVPGGPAPAASDLGEDVRELLERVTAGIGIRCRVELSEDEEAVTASLTGGDLGLLIGRHGQTIDAIQYLVERGRVPHATATAGRAWSSTPPATGSAARPRSSRLRCAVPRRRRRPASRSSSSR